MSSWQDFEKFVFKYLRRRYSDDGQIDFIEAGGANSNELDIRVIGKNGGELLIEVKQTKSQAGQFMLSLENNIFSFQPTRQDSHPTILQKELINEINHLGKKSVDQKGFEVKYEQNLICRLVKEHYSKKGASFLVTGEQKNLCIIPLPYLCKAFIFSVHVRRKKSGSRSIPKSKRNEILKRAIEAKMTEINVKLLEINLKEKDVMIKYSGEASIQEKLRYFSHLNETLYLSGSDGYFRLKLTSRTNNITVLYGANYSEICEPSWEISFKEKLRTL